MEMKEDETKTSLNNQWSHKAKEIRSLLKEAALESL